MNIYLDIETIPSQRDDVRKGIEEGITPPGNFKKQESIDKWMEENKNKAVEEKLHKTGLDGTWGEIVCIGWAINDEQPKCVYRDLNGSEAEVLEKFYSVINGLNLTWIGHNIIGFDLRFIWNRSVINGIRPSVSIPYDAKPWDKNVFDTMTNWSGFKSNTSSSLDAISKAMGYEGKGDLDGSKVWDYVKNGRILEVVEYCKDDVEKTRLLHKRMTFSKDC